MQSCYCQESKEGASEELALIKWEDGRSVSLFCCEIQPRLISDLLQLDSGVLKCVNEH